MRIGETLIQTQLKEISNVLVGADTVLIFPHINIDGDALGSSVAICKALRDMGKKSYVVYEEPLPNTLAFLDKHYCIFPTGENVAAEGHCKISGKEYRYGEYTKEIFEDTIEKIDVSVCVDCGDERRVGKRLPLCLEAEKTVCIDHHYSRSNFCMVNCIDEKAAATGELIFDLLKEMNVSPDKEIGEAIFAAISTDTGKFQYSNTREKTHRIAAELYGWGIDASRICSQIYQNDSIGKRRIEAMAVTIMDIFSEGRCAITYVTQEMLCQLGIRLSDTEGIIDLIRDIAGVEFAAFLKEKEDGTISVSFRAKTRGNVAEIAKKYGGGGHIQAAGCTLKMTMETALAVMKEELCRVADSFDKK